MVENGISLVVAQKLDWAFLVWKKTNGPADRAQPVGVGDRAADHRYIPEPSSGSMKKEALGAVT